ncbi:hypothetical protein SAMN05660484_02273 [Eubacterium ruminantium]|uniref:DUF4367 domain-containing protein n=1 Tax=Eubacterium ruminantium TaxID=42322 RepID=A0A1T4PZ20_9FIRM|nr:MULTISPECIES: hypothetical protein [Eubacterium]MCR5368667.1 hypothetical protein [Eubacterium sp.]SCW64919.1 hypothetical protein SAMN05660484_02273 [Eubacterium ruminantium]SDN22749.1 hypothetical protein SAMN04490370_1144 [Eubacterium ruminantium]SJZ96218.1 hypothetical protein SAMN02745110_02167 [Eubacterium ruminantium]
MKDIKKITDNEFDEFMHMSLAPHLKPDDKLNSQIIEQANKKKDNKSKVKKSNINFFLRAAIVFIAFMVIGSTGVYAAKKLGKNKETVVKDNHIISGNNVNDYDRTDLPDNDHETLVSKNYDRVYGGENDNWIFMDETLLNNVYRTKTYTYDDYLKALYDSGFENWFNFDIKPIENYCCYSITVDEKFDTEERMLDVSFYYHDGVVSFNQNLRPATHDPDGLFMVQVDNPENTRVYNTENETFTLVDSVNSKDGLKDTYVNINYEDYYGYIIFYNLSEDEIHEVLDNVELKSKTEDKK